MALTHNSARRACRDSGSGFWCTRDGAAVLLGQVEQVPDLGGSQNGEQGAPDQLSKQILGVVAGIFQGDDRDVPGLDAAALATDALHHAVGLVAARIDAFVLNADFSNTG